MAQMIDSEGAVIPKDEYGRKLFNITLFDWFECITPELSICIPMFFEGEDGDKYDSAGALTVPLQDVLEEYLEEARVDTDNRAYVAKFVALLRDYANRLEASTAQ